MTMKVGRSNVDEDNKRCCKIMMLKTRQWRRWWWGSFSTGTIVTMMMMASLKPRMLMTVTMVILEARAMTKMGDASSWKGFKLPQTHQTRTRTEHGWWDYKRRATPSRCKVCLSVEESGPKETIIALWYDLIMNIRAQYEEQEGSSDTVEVARLSFQQSWSNLPLDYVDGVPKWCYAMPKWLFPPWHPNHEGTWYFSEILQVKGWYTHIVGW